MFNIPDYPLCVKHWMQKPLQDCRGFCYWCYSGACCGEDSEALYHANGIATAWKFTAELIPVSGAFCTAAYRSLQYNILHPVNSHCAADSNFVFFCLFFSIIFFCAICLINPYCSSDTCASCPLRHDQTYDMAASITSSAERIPLSTISNRRQVYSRGLTIYCSLLMIGYCLSAILAILLALLVGESITRPVLSCNRSDPAPTLTIFMQARREAFNSRCCLVLWS